MTKRYRLTIDIEPAVHSKLKIVCTRRGTTMRDYSTRAIEQRLAEEPAERLISTADPVLAELWDNEDDSVYDEF